MHHAPAICHLWPEVTTAWHPCENMEARFRPEMRTLKNHSQQLDEQGLGEADQVEPHELIEISRSKVPC